MSEELKVEKATKIHKSKVQKDTYKEEAPNRRMRRELKDNKFYFYYEKQEGPNAPHDFRLQLKKVICARFKNTPACDIPQEFEQVLKFGTKFIIVFENKEAVDENELISPLKFSWCKGIEENEYGIIDN